MDNSSNPDLQLAYEFVENTDKNIFLTGKAGTGKTTFLHKLKNTSFKRMVVLAPTGVAAINAGGVTIHSFFQLPFGPQVPMEKNNNSGYPGNFQQQPKREYRKFSREKLNIIRSLDLLVIDEISMVRADLLDGIDEVLRMFKDRNKPFGGVQLLMIGDLQQLAPVVKDDDWDLLRKYYDTPFFFGSRALQKTNYISIELKKVYRQSDQKFIDLLNKVRNNDIEPATLQELNKRYFPGFKNDSEGYIILTTHNYQAKEINEARMNKLPEQANVYKARVMGEFSEYNYPTDAELTLKIGAQVMFVKNDPSRDKKFYNGKIGKVEEIEDDIIFVRCPDDDDVIAVEPLTWQNMKYSLNKDTLSIEEQEIGSFTQYPLKAAWAITIHKSQGLTFEKAIIDAKSAFAHGQVYVALSRCKSLEGLVLSSQISTNGLINNSSVSAFNKSVEENQPDESILYKSKIEFQHALLSELFDFIVLQRQINYLLKATKEHRASIHPSLLDNLEKMSAHFNTEILAVSNKFSSQIKQHLSSEEDINKNTQLQERIKKACLYFEEKFNEYLVNILENTEIDIDNKVVRKSLTDAKKRLYDSVNIYITCLNSCKNGFDAKKFIETRAKAAIELPKAKEKTTAKQRQTPSLSKHPVLYEKLKSWRSNKASTLNLPFYMILPQKTMTDVSSLLPASFKELKAVKGMGLKKVNSFGSEILEIIRAYCQENNIPFTLNKEPLPGNVEKEKKIKKASQTISFELYKEGKTISEIATERGFAESTIEGHLSQYISTGEISIEKFVSSEKLEKISAYFINNPANQLTPAKMHFGDEVTYGELRMILKHLEYTGKLSVPK